MRRISIPVALCLSALMVFCSGCDDDTLHGAAPIADNYYTGTTGTAPRAADLLPIPESDVIDIDFGLVDVGSIAHRYLFIANEGAGDLLLVNLAIDPDTSLNYLIEGDTTPAIPGSYLIIKITYAPGEVGPDTGSFVLTLNTTEHRVVTVNITGEGVSPEIQVCISDCTGGQQEAACSGAPEICNDRDKDSIIVEFGDADMEEHISRDVVIRNLGNRTLQISDVKKYGGATFVFEVDKNDNVPGVLSPGDEIVVNAIYAPFYGGEHLSSLRVISNDVNEPEVEVVLRGRGMAPRICPEPMVLDFGNVVTGQTATRTFTLTNCGLLEVELYDVKMAPGSSQDFSLPSPPTLPTTLAVGAAVTVEVQYYPQTSGSDAGGVEIYSSDITSNPDHLTGTVELLGRSDPNVCDILATPFAVNFGSIEVGQSATIDLVLSNVGNDTCVLDRVEITQNTPDGEFALNSGPAQGTSFDPGDIVHVGLGYNPATHGQDVGILSVFGNDKDTTEVRIDLNGFGLYPGGEGPVAVCSVNPVSTVPLTTITWYGEDSYDTNNRPITVYNWTIISFPAGSAARLIGTSANRYTEVDLAGTYIAELTVENDLGQVSRPCRAAATVTPTEDLWIEMYWTYAGDDMDLHLLSPGGSPRTSGDCYFMNCTGWFPPDWGVSNYDGDDPHLDLDDIPGTGPENINIADPADGVYTVFVHDYPGSVNDTPNPVTVNVYVDGALIQTFNETLTTEDQDWYVCEIDWPSGTVTPL